MLDRLPGAARRGQDECQPHHRGGPPGRRRAASGPRAAGAGRHRRDPRSGPTADIEAAKAAGHGRPAGRGRLAGASVPPSGSSSATSTVRPSSQLIESYINQVGGHAADGRRRPDRRLRGGAVRGRPGRGRPRRGRGRAVPLRPRARGQRRAARRRSPTRTSRPTAASRSSRTCSGARRRTPPRRWCRWWSAPAGPATCPAIVDSLVELSAARGRQGGRRGPLGRPPHRGPAAPPGRRPRTRPPARTSRSRSSSTRRCMGGLVTQIGDTVIDGTVRASWPSSARSDLTPPHRRRPGLAAEPRLPLDNGTNARWQS